MKKILTAMLCALFALLPLSACESGDGAKKVRVSEVTHSVFYAPMYAADALGYFEEEGIEIELTNGGGADNVMAAVLSGSVDIGFCGPEEFVLKTFLNEGSLLYLHRVLQLKTPQEYLNLLLIN